MTGIHWHQGRPYDDSHRLLTRGDLAAELTDADHIEARAVTNKPTAAAVPRTYDVDPDDVLAGYERAAEKRRAS